MGTTWRVTVSRQLTEKAHDELREAVTARLEEIEAKMSHWREDSEVSVFNRAGAIARVEVSEETAWVVAFAQEMRVQSRGAFDVTVATEVAARGFGPESLRPAAEENVPRGGGGEHLQVSTEPPFLLKELGGLAIDLSGVAKGYAVDQVAALLDAKRFENYLVELGGELKGRGRAPDGDWWAIGLENPDPLGRKAPVAVELRNEAIATSGNYRLFRQDADGGIRSHLIDPRSEKDQDQLFRSVSVIHPSAAEADAWATALFVMGEEEGLAVAARSGLVARFVESPKSGMSRGRSTASFDEREVVGSRLPVQEK